MHDSLPESRRSALTKIASGAVLTAASATFSRPLLAAEAETGPMKGRINHSVCKWCYSKVSLEDLCAAGKTMGLQSVELLTIDDFPRQFLFLKIFLAIHNYLDPI